MYGKIRKNYMKLVLPIAAVLLLACAVLLIVTKFGIRYAFVTSVPIESIPASELEGACAQVQTTQLEGTFARAGYITQDEADEEGTEVDIIQRYCMAMMDDGRYIGVRVTGDHLKDVEAYTAAITELGTEAASAMDFGLMRGTVSKMSGAIYDLFCSWADQYLEGETGTAAFYEANLYPYMLDVDFYGPYSQGVTIFMTVVALILFVLAVAVLAVSLAGFWDRSVKKEARAVGKEKLAEEFEQSEPFAGKLYLGKEHIWCFKTFSTEVLRTGDVIWAYARSRRLEGGKLTWLFVMKTADKREYSALLGEAANVQAAEEKLKTLVRPLCVGFDKEKQKLYEKDVNTFKARVKNGTI